jgi:hypothetical protein
MFFDNTKTSYIGTNTAPLNSFGIAFFTPSEVNAPNATLPTTNTGYIEVGGIFLNGGVPMSPGGSELLFTITFDNTSVPSAPNNDSYFISTLDGDIAVGYGIPSNSDLDLVANGPQQQSLPITLKSFTAAKFDDISSKLDWITSTEINGSHFEIERSENAHDWTKIGIVQAVGESYENINYEYIDQNVGILRSTSTFYYRLKMVDNDGTFEYSDVRSVSFDQDGIDVSVYPNPVTDKLTLNVSSEDNDEAEMIIFDSSGKILIKNKISSNGITEVDVNNVPSGVILMKVVKNNSVYTKRIIKVD